MKQILLVLIIALSVYSKEPKFNLLVYICPVMKHEARVTVKCHQYAKQQISDDTTTKFWHIPFRPYIKIRIQTELLDDHGKWHQVDQVDTLFIKPPHTNVEIYVDNCK